MRDVIDDFVIFGDDTLSTCRNCFQFLREECARDGEKRHPIEKNISQKTQQLAGRFSRKRIGQQRGGMDFTLLSCKGKPCLPGHREGGVTSGATMTP